MAVSSLVEIREILTENGESGNPSSTCKEGCIPLFDKKRVLFRNRCVSPYHRVTVTNGVIVDGYGGETHTSNIQRDTVNECDKMRQGYTQCNG